MLEAIDRRRIEWVLTGSLVLVAYGAELTPNDLDLTPAMSRANRDRVAALLDTLDAIPLYEPGWDQYMTLDDAFAWRPMPSTKDNLDHLFVTSLGRLDIVPHLCGSYQELLPDSTTLEIGGVMVNVADPQTVIERIDQVNRPKDAHRTAEIERARGSVEAGAPPHSSNLERLVEIP